MDQFLHFWYHYTQYYLALDKIVYCENIATHIKSHLNRKYAMDFIRKSLQEMPQKLYQAYWLKMHYMTNINNASGKK